MLHYHYNVWPFTSVTVFSGTVFKTYFQCDMILLIKQWFWNCTFSDFTNAIINH